jgi:hypothetical protein
MAAELPNEDDNDPVNENYKPPSQPGRVLKLSRCRQTLEKIQPCCSLPPARNHTQKAGQLLSSYFLDTTLVTVRLLLLK